MKSVATVVKAHLAESRWNVTRDVIRGQPELLARVIDDLTIDLQLLETFAANIDANKPVDIRIALEHVVILLGRLVPAVNTALADLYTWTLSRRTSSEWQATSAQLTVIRDVAELVPKWQRLIAASSSAVADDAATICELASVVATLNARAATALAQLLRAEMQSDRR